MVKARRKRAAAFLDEAQAAASAGSRERLRKRSADRWACLASVPPAPSRFASSPVPGHGRGEARRRRCRRPRSRSRTSGHRRLTARTVSRRPLLSDRSSNVPGPTEHSPCEGTQHLSTASPTCARCNRRAAQWRHKTPARSSGNPAHRCGGSGEAEAAARLRRGGMPGCRAAEGRRRRAAGALRAFTSVPSTIGAHVTDRRSQLLPSLATRASSEVSPT